MIIACFNLCEQLVYHVSLHMLYTWYTCIVNRILACVVEMWPSNLHLNPPSFNGIESKNHFEWESTVLPKKLLAAPFYLNSRSPDAHGIRLLPLRSGSSGLAIPKSWCWHKLFTCHFASNLKNLKSAKSSMIFKAVPAEWPWNGSLGRLGL